LKSKILKMKTKNPIYTLALICILFIVTGSCKKDQDNEVIKDDRLPIISTSAVSALTEITATCGGDVSGKGGSDVTARGLCWSMGQTPTLQDNLVVSGTGTGTFSKLISGLTANTPYYVRAYATNSYGTSYGETKSFTTLQAGADRDKLVGSWLFSEISLSRNVNITYVVIITKDSENNRIQMANFSGIGTGAPAYGIVLADSITVPSQSMANDYLVEGGGKMTSATTIDWKYSITSLGDLNYYAAHAVKQ
jgi:hypothetical protein